MGGGGVDAGMGVWDGVHDGHLASSGEGDYSMKGKTNQPRMILVDTNLLALPEIQALAEQGYTVTGIMGETPLQIEYDLILSTKAWRWDEKYLALAIKAARAAKKGEKE